MFLKAEDIVKLTGYIQARAQIRWLHHNGWRFSVNALGRPIVAMAEWSRKMVGSAASALTQQEPNWDAVNGPETIN